MIMSPQKGWTLRQVCTPNRTAVTWLWLLAIESCHKLVDGDGVSLWQSVCSDHLTRLSAGKDVIEYKVTNWLEQSPAGEANRHSLVKKFPAFCGTRRFITAFTRARDLSLSWARSIQSMSRSHLLRIRFNIIFHLRLRLPSGLFP
jgi:hypothetical protein